MAKIRSVVVAAAFLLVSGSASYAQQTDMQQVQGKRSVKDACR